MGLTWGNFFDDGSLESTIKWYRFTHGWTAALCSRSHSLKFEHVRCKNKYQAARTLRGMKYRAHEPMAVLKENNTQLFFSFLEFLEQSIELLLFRELKIPWFRVNEKYHG